MQALQKDTSNECINHTHTGLRESDMILIQQYDSTKFLNQIYFLAPCAIASGLMFSGCLLAMMCIHAGVGLVQSCANFRGKLFSCLFVIILKTQTKQEGTSPCCASPLLVQFILHPSGCLFVGVSPHKVSFHNFSQSCTVQW